jgi:phosphatase NudJ
VFFTATPLGDPTPRATPNEHSLGAAWVAVDDLVRYPLRGEEVREIFGYVARGGPVAPASMITLEGAPWRG